MNCDRANESTGLEARATDSGSPKAQRLEPNNGLDYPQGVTYSQDTLRHQESEIKEEVFTPDIQEVEEFRLQALVQTRSYLRNVEEDADYDEVEDDCDDIEDEEEAVDGNQLFITREQIQALHHQLSAESDVIATPQKIMQTAVDSLDQSKKKSSTHDYINQAVVDMVLNEPTTDSASNASNLSMPGTDHEFKRVPSSNGYKSQGNPSISISKYNACRQQPVALLEKGELGEFEKRLLLAKHKSKGVMPNVYKIPWYHPGISRHIAESLLFSKNTRDGTYLLRDCVSEPDTVTLSVKCPKSVKHYRVTWDGKQLIFGLGKFNTLDEFKEHFSHQPVISGESGVLVQLRYPYPRGVSEPAIYFEANEISDVDVTELENKQKPVSSKTNKQPKLLESLAFSINSKEGYLTKLGFHRKNWKKRWFVLYKSELKYFNCCGDKEPLKVINLEDVTSIDRDDSAGKSNCFRLVTSNRTFFMYATSEVEANEWVQILDWKLKQQSKR